MNKDRIFLPTGNQRSTSQVLSTSHLTFPGFGRTGFQSKQLIVNGGLRLGDVSQFTHIDVTIDGADESVLTSTDLFLQMTDLASLRLGWTPN